MPAVGRAVSANKFEPLLSAGVLREDVVESCRDEELLAQYLAGDAGAFEFLVRRYADDLHGFLVRFVGDAAAEDLVQETFLQVHLAAQSFDPQRSFRPWLYTIAANKARDFLRSRARKHEQTLDSPGGDGEGPSAAQLLAADGPSVAEERGAEETRQAVRALIARMPEHLQLILMLGYYQKLAYAEIAEILDIPVGTVKSRLHAAVTRFARMWQGQARGTTSGRP
jgi:RNA polymerase sigma-70 factor (ECF subfamily)